MKRLISLSLRYRTLVICFAAFLLVYGSFIVKQLPIDVLPDLNRPTLTLLTEAKGMAPEEVEKLITLPLETNLQGLPGLVNIRSSSTTELSILYLEFDWKEDPLQSRQQTIEKLQNIKNLLPENIEPELSPLSSIMGEILLVGLSSKQLQAKEIRSFADWSLKLKLLSIPGISQIINMGGGVKQYEIQILTQELKQLNLKTEEVINVLEKLKFIPEGGFINEGGKELAIRFSSSNKSIDDIKKIIVSQKNGVSIPLEQIAQIEENIQTQRGDASINAQPGVILSIQKQNQANTLLLNQKIIGLLEEEQKNHPEISIQPLFQQSHFIEAATQNVKEALRDGSILVLIVLSLFLLNFRTSLITLTAIPLSFIVTAFIFHLFGLSINTMTLGGLSIAIGELVDDAIVDVENIQRRLKENKKREQPLSSIEVIYKASLEIRTSIIYSTLLVILVFFPLFSLSGVEGKLFSPLGFTYIISILASLLVSVTLTPALCLFLLPQASFLEKEESKLVRFLKKQDLKLLHYCLAHPKIPILITLLLLSITLTSIPFIPKNFLPSFNEGSLTINLFSEPGISLHNANEIGTIAEKILLSIPEVKNVGRRTGRAEMDEHAEGLHYSEIDVELGASKRNQTEITDEIRMKLSSLPGINLSIGQPISHRIDHLLSGVQAPIVIKVFGPQLEELRQIADEIKTSIQNIAGLNDLQIEAQTKIPQLQIQFKEEKIKQYRLNPSEINSQLELYSHGKIVTQLYEANASINVLFKLKEAGGLDKNSFEKILIDLPENGKIPLGEIANVVVAEGPNLINHENALRRIVISANTSEGDLSSIANEIQNKIKDKIQVPTGYHLSFEGQFKNQKSSTQKLLLFSCLSFFVIFYILYHHFHSYTLVLQILINIPLALIGAFAALWISGQSFSLASLIGLIALCGIASRNTIMMISHYIHLITIEKKTFCKETIIQASLERLIPVLMTALSASLGLIPLVLNPHAAGKEILYPVSVVILGGLVSSTLLDMLLTPSLFYLFGEKAVKHYIQKGEKNEMENRIFHSFNQLN